MKPVAEAFVDDEAGPEGDPEGAAPSAAFHRPPHRPRSSSRLLALSRERRPSPALLRGVRLSGCSRGFAITCPAPRLPTDIKALDQDARGIAAQAWCALRAVSRSSCRSCSNLRADAAAPRSLGAVGRGWMSSPKARARPRDDPARDGPAAGLLYDVGLSSRGSPARSSSTCWSAWRTCCAGRNTGNAAGSRRRPTCCSIHSA